MSATLRRFQALREEYLDYIGDAPTESNPMSFEFWLIEKLDKALISNDPPYAPVVGVSAEDLSDVFSEDDLQYVTQGMLNEIADTVWYSDEDGWGEMFNHCLGSAITDNWQDWQDMIEAEKKRRQNNANA